MENELNSFLSDAVNQIQDDDPESADVVVIGPPTGRQDSDLENEDDEILNTTRVTWENRWWSWSLQYYDEIERITSDGEDGDVEPSLGQKQKQNTKKNKINVKWQRQHIQTQTFSSVDHDKNAQAVFLENPELTELTMWTSFEKVVCPFIE